MARSRLVWAVVLAFSQWISLSAQLEWKCIFSGHKVEVVFEAEHPDITAPPDYFYKQLLQAQHDFFFSGQSSAIKQEPKCYDSKSTNWITVDLENMPDTRLVRLDHNRYKVINETASINRRIWVTSVRPFEHYRDVTETGKWREVLVGSLYGVIYSWKNGAPDDDLIYSWEEPELTQERVLSVMSRCDACIQEGPESNGKCGGCCWAGHYPWYCGIGTLDEW